jgi:hypothetical protein
MRVKRQNFIKKAGRAYRFFMALVIFLVVLFVAGSFLRYSRETKILDQIINRLEAETRIAEVMVTGVNYDEQRNKNLTTIKFVEYDAGGEPLKPLHFTFTGNIIQFQSLVIRFDDIHIRQAHKLKGKSAYLFWKVFMLDKANTQEYDINAINEVPRGYMVGDGPGEYEKKLWEKFWQYALDPHESHRAGIKSAQIEAPGTMFLPGIIYTLLIEHDGGIRIEAKPLPAILKGESIPPSFPGTGPL